MPLVALVPSSKGTTTGIPPLAAYVYLLVHSHEARFKIGKSADVLARARALGIREFSLEKSWVLKVPNETRALQVEQALHRIFDPWRVPKDVLRGRAPLPRKGYTEWFRLGVLKRMHRFVESSLDVLNAQLQPLPEMTPAPRRRARSPLQRRSRAASRRSKPARQH